MYTHRRPGGQASRRHTPRGAERGAERVRNQRRRNPWVEFVKTVAAERFNGNYSQAMTWPGTRKAYHEAKRRLSLGGRRAPLQPPSSAIPTNRQRRAFDRRRKAARSSRRRLSHAPFMSRSRLSGSGVLDYNRAYNPAYRGTVFQGGRMLDYVDEYGRFA